MSLTHLELPVRYGDPWTLKKNKLGPPNVIFKTDVRAVGEGEEKVEWAHRTQSHPFAPSERPDLSWSCTFGSCHKRAALTSHQDQGNHRGQGSMGRSLRAQVRSPGKGLKRGKAAGKNLAFGVGPGFKFWLHLFHLGDFEQVIGPLQI